MYVVRDLNREETMPEGDTLYRTARTLTRAFEGRVVTAFRSTFPKLLRFNDDTPLVGQTITRIESRGKYLLIHFSGGGTLVTHMLMNGSWHIYRPGERWHKPSAQMRIVIETSDYIAVGFQIPVAEMHTADSLRRHPRIPALEHDVLRPEFDLDTAVAKLLALPNEEIAEALLDQRITAGVGNEFKSETCFVARVHPIERISALSRARLEEIVAAAQRLLHANILEAPAAPPRAWRSTTHSIGPTANTWVYERTGQPCRICSTPILRRLQGPNARATYWCPLCQPLLDNTSIDS
jgi:endonuclease-8